MNITKPEIGIIEMIVVIQFTQFMIQIYVGTQ
jgi:hypothetical protein